MYKQNYVINKIMYDWQTDIENPKNRGKQENILKSPLEQNI